MFQGRTGEKKNFVFWKSSALYKTRLKLSFPIFVTLKIFWEKGELPSSKPPNLPLLVCRRIDKYEIKKKKSKFLQSIHNSRKSEFSIFRNGLPGSFPICRNGLPGLGEKRVSNDVGLGIYFQNFGVSGESRMSLQRFPQISGSYAVFCRLSKRKKNCPGKIPLCTKAEFRPNQKKSR